MTKIEQCFYKIQTNPILEFHRGLLGLPIPVRPRVLGEIREGEMKTLVDPQGNCYGKIAVRNGNLLIHHAQHIVGYSGHIELVKDGAMVDGSVFLQHRGHLVGPLPMIKIQRAR